MAAQRQPAESGSPDQGGEPFEAEHFLVVFAGYNRPWATWIAHRLEQHGHRVTLLRWDPPRSIPLETALQDLLLATGRVLLVLSEWFFQLGPRPDGEWNSVLRGIVAQNRERFAAVNLTNLTLLTATSVLEPVDLWGIGASEAEFRLFQRLGLPLGRPEHGFGSPLEGPRYPNDPPTVWGGVPRRNSRFTGRDELLNDLQKQLTDAQRGTAICALLGMSGIGKTQMAVEYAYRFQSEYDVVWWVNSDQRGTLRERLSELAPELGLVTGSEPGERIRAVREALRQGRPYRRWLIIFDSWDDLDDAATLLPSGPGHVLITSRNRGWAIGNSAVIETPGFSREESTAYLMRRARRLSETEADHVASEFDDIPLQLAQAAAWLGESTMDVSEYLRLVRSGQSIAIGEREAGGGLDDYPVSSQTSWAILLNRLRETEPHAAELLKLCVCFAPGRIPLGMVRQLPVGDLPPSLSWLAEDPLGWTRALDALVHYSVVTKEYREALGDEAAAAPGLEAVHMHRLVHQIIRGLTSREDHEVYAQVVRRLLAAADPGRPSDSRLWPRYAELLPHLDPSGALGSSNPKVQRFVLNCLRYCFISGEYRSGLEISEKVRSLWSDRYGPGEPQMLELTYHQSNVMRAAGLFRQSYELNRAAVERLRGEERVDELALLRAAGTLAADQRSLGQYTEALQLQREVLDGNRRLLGPDEYRTLNAQHNLAVGLRLLGRYQEAYELDLDTLRRRENALRARHPTTLNSGNACARDLRLMGKYRDALARQELGVRLHIQVLGPNHPQTLRARHNLAQCLRRAGNPHDAGGLLQSHVEQTARVHGETHHAHLVALADYGNYLREHGDLGLARELTNRAESGLRGLLGTTHPASIGMQSNVGLVLQAAGERSDALSMFEQALAGLTVALGPDHPWVLGCALNAAGGRNFTGKIESAMELSRETMRRARNALGEDHPLTLSCEVSLAADLRGLGEHQEAGKVEDDALQRLARTLGAQHPHALSARQRVRPYWDYEPYLG